jgi:hypothetical protein
MIIALFPEPRLAAPGGEGNPLADLPPADVLGAIILARKVVCPCLEWDKVHR